MLGRAFRSTEHQLLSLHIHFGPAPRQCATQALWRDSYSPVPLMGCRNCHVRHQPFARAVCVMPDRRLKLSLSAGESLPTACSWMIDDGYLLVGSWSQQGELTTLSIWGPGDIVIPALIHTEPLVLSSLSTAKVEEWAPTPQEEQRFLHAQLQQLTTLLTLTRMRSAETRLYQLLLWLGERFGRVNRSGVSLSFQGMNLTHQQLASIAGMTRVTVTKALTSFRKEGKLIRQGEDELLRLPDQAGN